LVGVSAILQEQADHLGRVAEDSIVQSCVAVFSERELSELGAELKHGSGLREVLPADGIAESLQRDAVDVGFEFRPALESISSREDELRVMEGEGRRIGVVVVSGDFRGCGRVAGEECGEQFLGLAAKLV